MGKKGFKRFLTGAAVGATLGLLFAPKTGKETRKEVMQKCKEILEQLKSIDAEDLKKSITKKVKEIENELKDLDKEKVLAIAKEKGAQLEKKAAELYELAKKKGTPLLEKTTKELKSKTADALKKIIAKLEN